MLKNKNQQFKKEQSCNKGIGEQVDRAEKEEDITLIPNANAFMKSMKDKQHTLSELMVQKQLKEEFKAYLISLCLSDVFNVIIWVVFQFRFLFSVTPKNFVCFFFDSFQKRF